MIGDVTQVQGDDERHLARDLSLQRQRPPTDVPGYEPERFLGAGAYGEVWVAVDRNTGRRVAIKFYAHRGGLDWSLLSREVDKLALLFSDRYVVQLIEVGWNADPPYYVMEFLEHGSLEDRLQTGPMPVGEAVALFREVAVALVHAHGKGVLHCDLKPANVLLDQDGKPRLADFGQSRLSHEQTPALGTLFYMAPEQADLNAAPDARWDVYALGALLYCMITGHPPYRDTNLAAELHQTGTLEARLQRYRDAIRGAPRPSAHHHLPGVDHALIEVIDRCLARSPNQRFPNAQAVLDALDARALRRARRPMIVLGAFGPALLLSIVSLLAWNGFHVAVDDSTRSLTASAKVGNEFAAEVFAAHIANRIDRRWRVMQHVADDPEFQELTRSAVGKPMGSQPRLELQTQLEAIHQKHAEIPSVAWFLLDAQGTMLARSPIDEKTIDHNFAFRDYFHGLGRNFPQGTSTKPITQVHRSLIYQSMATGEYRTVAFSVPIWDGEPDRPERQVQGVLVTSVHVGDFTELRARGDVSQDIVPVLIDTREDEHGRRGAILIHPLFIKLRRENQQELPAFHVDPLTIRAWNDEYHDPVGQYDRDYAGRWFAASERVLIEGWPDPLRVTGFVVLVQERYRSAIGPVIDLKQKLIFRGSITFVVIILMLTALWLLVLGVLNRPSQMRLSALWRSRSEGSASLTGTGMRTPVGVPPRADPLQPTTRMQTEPSTKPVTEAPTQLITEPPTQAAADRPS